MTILIRCLMLLTMLLHSVFGCGWHQIHACAHGTTTVGSTCQHQHGETADCRKEHQHGKSHRHSEGSQNEPPAKSDVPEHQHRHSSDCDHSICCFVAPGSAVVPPSMPGIEQWLIPQMNSVLSCAALKTLSDTQPSLSAPLFARTMRAKLQVWRT